MLVRSTFPLLAAQPARLSSPTGSASFLTYIVEASFSQLFGAYRDTRWPVDEGEQPLFALLHGGVGHVAEGRCSCGQLGGQSSRHDSGQRHVVGSVAPDKTAVWIMPLVFGHGSVARFPVTQLQIHTDMSVRAAN